MNLYSMSPLVDQFQALQFSGDESSFPFLASQLSPPVFELLSARALGHPVETIESAIFLKFLSSLSRWTIMTTIFVLVAMGIETCNEASNVEVAVTGGAGDPQKS